MTPECRVQSIVVLELQTTTTKFAISPRLVTVTMDPFSWVAGTIDLIDVCARFAAFLKDFETAAANVDREIQTLSKDVDAVKLDIQESPSSDDQLFEHIRKLNLKLEHLPPQLELSHNKSAEAVLSFASANKHFDIPQTVSSIHWRTLFAPSSAVQSPTQERFVIYGVGGSGKTQFCCKFAQDYRKHFWGIFWINASSDERASQTFSRLAKQFGGREPNERAAKNWLSNLELPWLLIIDNADDSSTDIGTHFPEGERGSVLITTRNPAYKVHGTIGSRFFEFGQLVEEPASDLLLKAAGRPTPSDQPTRSWR
ncbi:hypothetical protein MMC08_002289 [Hypocenomyce scalaris]|nr:hypothetical protein [Hypocenomyce scalaris]